MITNTFLFGSPIEAQFFACWRELGYDLEWALIPQYPIESYFVDFAIPELLVAIELDGFDHHSSAVDIANDRRRQRDIERHGWHVIRFGGREIYLDVMASVLETKAILEERAINEREPS